MVYRARRKGGDIITRKRTIYRAYSNSDYPPPIATRADANAGVWFWNTITN
jgi:hypothetical protein